MRIHGRCHCGFIAYEAEIDPEKVMICHCTDCQTLRRCQGRPSGPPPSRAREGSGCFRAR